MWHPNYSNSRVLGESCRQVANVHATAHGKKYASKEETGEVFGRGRDCQVVCVHGLHTCLTVCALRAWPTPNIQTRIISRTLNIQHSSFSASRDDPGAQFNTGMRFQEGLGCKQSYERAAQWFQKAALQGQPDAQGALADLCLEGRGVPQNYKRAVALYRQSAEQGHPLGHLHLGGLAGACWREDIHDEPR